MYRTAAKRLFGVGFTTSRLLRLPKLRSTVIPSFHTSRLCTSSMGNTESPIGNQSVNLNQSGPTAAASSSSSTATGEGPRRHESRKPRAEFQEEQARVLSTSLRHVPRLGWTEEAMIAGSRDVGVSPSIVGSFSRKEAALVEYFLDECLQFLIDRTDSGLDLQNLIPSERISKLIRIRLELQIPYMSKWPQALSIQAHPVNVPTSFKQREMLVDEIWHTVGDGASDLDWFLLHEPMSETRRYQSSHERINNSGELCDWNYDLMCEESTGYVFLRCVITDNGQSGYMYLGRPWGPFGRVVLAYTYLDACIKNVGWHNWGNAENERSACFYEYRCFGPGSCSSGRVTWSRELMDEEAGHFLHHSFVDPDQDRPWLCLRMGVKTPYSA